MGNSRAPADTETLLKITTDFEEKHTQKEKIKKLAWLMLAGGEADTNLHLSLKK